MDMPAIGTDNLVIDGATWPGPRAQPFIVQEFLSDASPWFTSPQDEPPPNEVHVVIQDNVITNIWMSQLDRMSDLHEGWNGYSAPAPSSAAILTARRYVSHLLNENVEPSRVAPSAMGGVGITHKRRGRRVYVEFYNNGDMYALFSDNETVPRSKQITPCYHEFRKLTIEIREYLDV